MDRYERGVLEICEDMLRRDSAATLSLFIGMVLSLSMHTLCGGQWSWPCWCKSRSNPPPPDICCGNLVWSPEQSTKPSVIRNKRSKKQRRGLVGGRAQQVIGAPVCMASGRQLLEEGTGALIFWSNTACSVDLASLSCPGDAGAGFIGGTALAASPLSTKGAAAAAAAASAAAAAATHVHKSRASQTETQLWGNGLPFDGKRSQPLTETEVGISLSSRMKASGVHM